MATTTDKVIAALDALEALGSPDAIAERLRAEGIKGVPCLATHCALAQYLRKKGGRGISVGSCAVWENSSDNLFKELDANVHTFRLQFDAHKYKFLER